MLRDDGSGGLGVRGLGVGGLRVGRWLRGGEGVGSEVGVASVLRVGDPAVGDAVLENNLCE